MLQAIAIVASLAVLLWSLGLPSLRFADAANLTTVSDTLSDSAKNASSTHTISFSTPTGVATNEYATVTMPSGFTGVDQITASDITMTIDGDGAQTVGANCTASDVGFTAIGQDLVFELCAFGSTAIGVNGTTTIVIGSDSGNRITNPSPSQESFSYEVSIAAGASDSGATRIVILDTVTVTASVDTIFTFAVSGTAAGTSMNGDTSSGDTTTTTIPFGTLSDGNATTAAQLLTVNTNAANGYSVSVQIDGPLESSTGATIDGFANGATTDDPDTWTPPSGTLGSPNTYGHWGVTSDDSSTSRTIEFASQEYIGVTTTPRVVMSNTGPAAGEGVGVGTTTVGYKIEISALQEAGDDYSTTLTYIATPTF
jgi:hypothetical protein